MLPKPSCLLVCARWWFFKEKKKKPTPKVTLLAAECSRDDVIGTVGGEKRKTSLCVLILFAALKGMESRQGEEFWETI